MPETPPSSAVGFYAHVTGIAINPDKGTTKATIEINVLDSKRDQLMALLEASKTTLRVMVWEHEVQTTIPGIGKGKKKSAVE